MKGVPLQFFVVGALTLGSLYFLAPTAATKALACITLSALSYLEESGYGSTVAGGLVFSAMGDVLLELQGKTNFLLGLVSFLIAHLFYIYAFYAHSKIDYSYGIGCGILLIAFYSSMMYALLPDVESDLKVPIIVYGSVISTMTFLAFNRYFSPAISRTSRLLSLVGSVFFVVSDSLLAFDKFKFPINNAKIYIMITYWIGQCMIAMSCKECKDGRVKRE